MDMSDSAKNLSFSPSEPISSVFNIQEAQVRDEIQRGFTTLVYGWMTIGLLITAAVALFTISTPGLLASVATNPFVFFGPLLGEIAVVFALSLVAYDTQRLKNMSLSQRQDGSLTRNISVLVLYLDLINLFLLLLRILGERRSSL